MDIVKLFVTDSRFWLAFYALAQVILFWAVPDFPREIWTAIDALIVVVIGIITGQSVISRARAARGMKR